MQVRYLALALAGGLLAKTTFFRRRRNAFPPDERHTANGCSRIRSNVHQPHLQRLQTASADCKQQSCVQQSCVQIESDHVLIQTAIAILVALGANAFHGRALALTVAATSALLIFGAMASAAFAAVATAWWQVDSRQAQLPRMQSLKAQRSSGPIVNAEIPNARIYTGSRSELAVEFQRTLPPPMELTGTWDKDVAASESMESAIKAMRLNPIIRKGATLVRGIKINVTNEDFYMAVFSAIPWFKVVERYPLSGEQRKFKRRDFRRGSHVGWCEVQSGGRVAVSVKWGAPIGGSGTDTFRIASPGVLHVDTVMNIHDGPELKYRMIYNIRKEA